MGDAAVVADFLSIVSHRSGLLSLDMTVVLLPTLTKMLTNQFDQYVSNQLLSCDLTMLDMLLQP